MQHHSTHVNGIDEEAQDQHSLEETFSQEQIDEEHFIDGVSVEDWILKTQEQAERDRSASFQSNHARRNGGVARGKQVDREVSEEDRSVAVAPAAPELNHPDEQGSNSNVVRMMDFSGRSTIDRTDGTGNDLLYAESVNMPHDFFVANELSMAPKDRFLMVEGVRTNDLSKRSRTLLTLVCVLIVFMLIAVAAGFITRGITSSTSRSPNPSNSTMVTSTPLDETFASKRLPRFNMTIADSLTINRIGDGFTITDTFAGQLFLETVKRTDTNFTFFGIASSAKIFGDLDPSFLGMATTELWIGHLLNAIEGNVIEGQAVTTEDMYNGMILKSISGYPLVIQLDPIRVNNVSLKMEERDGMYQNGISYSLSEYFSPIVAWIVKSIMDVLLETNEQRNQDLSAFIAMINTLPDIKALVLEEERLGKTLFVPTNQALSNVNLSLIANASMVMQFLRNHIASGNFVKRCWESIPTGTKVNDTELILDSKAGYELHLKIEDVVTINGGSTIIQEDIFSKGGVIHVIDKALLVDSTQRQQ